MAVDSISGSVYVTGSISGALDGKTHAGNFDMVLLKYSASGAWQWTQLRGTSGSDSGYGGENLSEVVRVLSD